MSGSDGAYRTRETARTALALLRAGIRGFLPDEDLDALLEGADLKALALCLLGILTTLAVAAAENSGAASPADALDELISSMQAHLLAGEAEAG